MSANFQPADADVALFDTLARDIEEACSTLAKKGGAHESEPIKIVTGPGH